MQAKPLPTRPSPLPVIGIGLFLLCLNALAYVWWVHFTQPGKFTQGVVIIAPATQSIVIADGHQPSFGLLYLADTEGYLKDEGLDVTFRSFASSKEALDDVIAGNAEIATAYTAPVVRDALLGQQLGIAAAINTSTTTTAIVARKDRGITSVQDLIGKSIGVVADSRGELLLAALLGEQGMPLTEVKIVNLKSADIPAALSDGTVDAVATSNLTLYKTVHLLPESSLTILEDSSSHDIAVLAGNRNLLEARPTVIMKMLRALLRAEHFMTEHKLLAQSDLAKRFPNYPVGAIDELWSAESFHLSLDAGLKDLLQKQIQSLSSTGSKTVPSYEQLLLTDYLTNVKSEDVVGN